MKKTSLGIVLRNAKETIRFGKKVGRLLKAGDVVALKGDLGAGKTTWVKGAAKGLDVSSRSEVASPTFVVIHEYQGREMIFHLDWYRLKKVEGADRDFAEECFAGKAVTFVEWPERGKRLLPAQTLWLEFAHVSPQVRKLSIRPGKKTRLELTRALKRLF
jgi:tRNA threonylcarbamoyladenosine biosynthesis protein TsaE